jgi:release factor glutamine methyltransferase
MSKPHWYSFQGIRVRLLPTVFHPGWLLSTRVLLAFLSRLDLKGKRLLELGAGSGLIALYAARQGAIVTATDINPVAIHAIHSSSLINNIPLHFIHSDLFEKIPLMEFDYILINPPYFPHQPKDDWEIAFYCGEKFEYFQRLFDQIIPYIYQHTSVYLILNQFCAIDRITALALMRGLELNVIHSVKKSGEMMYIFKLNKLNE